MNHGHVVLELSGFDSFKNTLQMHVVSHVVLPDMENLGT